MTTQYGKSHLVDFIHIYADGYIAFDFPFIRNSFPYVCGIHNTALAKVSPVVYISLTTYQKAFIFGR